MSIARMLGEAETAGCRGVELYRQQPTVLQHSELGSFAANSSVRALILRRFLLSIRVTPRLLAIARPFLQSPERLRRWDRFLWRYAYWHGVRRAVGDRETWHRLTRGPVILMYHAVARPGEAGSCYVVTHRRFSLQMAWLKWRRYHILSLSDFVACMREHRLPPARAVIITFDDGYADNYDRAFPVLRRYRFPATVFLVSGAVGGKAAWTDDPSLSGRPLLSQAQLEEMLGAGIDVGAHTRTHPSLTELPTADQEREVQGSRDDLERRFGRVIRTFAYPFGDYDTDVARVVPRAGFAAACCSRSGVNDPATPPFELRRVEVRGTDSLYRFALMVWCARRGRGGRATRQSSNAAARVHA